MNKILIKGEIYVNCYFIVDKKDCYIVDPGCDKKRIREYVKDNKLEVRGILLTHAHIENICAIDVFSVPIYMHRREYEIFIDIYNKSILDEDTRITYKLENLRIILIRDKDVLYLNEKKIIAIHTPGHTIGSVSYKFGNEIYTGDTLYKGRVGRWDLETGDLHSMKKSILMLLETFPAETIIKPLRGESTRISEERNNNYFYLEWKKDNK